MGAKHGRNPIFHITLNLFGTSVKATGWAIFGGEQNGARNLGSAADTSTSNKHKA